MSHAHAAPLILLTVAVLAVLIARRAGLPPLFAYLACGVAVGPQGLALFSSSHTLETLAEFGVVFLMFSIGLEFSLQRLKAMRGLVFGLGAAQVLLSLAGTVAVTVLYFGHDWRIGVAVGAACAMSSTAIVARLLAERFELQTPAGRRTMGVLIFQDLAVVPLLILIPALNVPADALLPALTRALVIATLVLAIILALGQRLMRRWFQWIARDKSDELFMLNVLWIVVGLSAATAWAGLSAALGAFLAGVLIAETVYRHQVEADIRPFRDVLLGLFFVTIGMMLDIEFVASNLGRVGLALMLFVSAKFGLMMLITLVARTPLHVAIPTSLHLAQAGEFGFVLLELSHERRLVPEDVFQVTIAAMLLSMFLAPFMIQRLTAPGGWLSRRRWMHDAVAVHDVASVSMGLKDHVILCGFGRNGQAIARFLSKEGIPYLALDTDETCIRNAARGGEKVVYGNAERPEILSAAGLPRARAVVITFPNAVGAERTLLQIRRQNADLPVILRAEDESEIARLKAAGATEVIPEVLEGSLMLAMQTLTRLGIDVDRAMGYVRSARAERYEILREYYRGSQPNRGG